MFAHLRTLILLALLLAHAGCAGGGPLVVRVDAYGTTIDGQQIPEEELDLVLEHVFKERGARNVELQAAPSANRDYLGVLMDRIHWASRAAGVEEDCEIFLRTVAEGAEPPPLEPEEPGGPEEHEGPEEQVVPTGTGGEGAP